MNEYGIKSTIEEWKKIVDEEKYKKALRNTAFDIAKQAFTQVRKGIKKEWYIGFQKENQKSYKIKSIAGPSKGKVPKRDGQLLLRQIKDGSTIEFYAITHNGYGIPLILFPYKGVVKRNKTGKVVGITKKTKLKALDKIAVKIKIKRNEPPTVLEDVFEATMKSGHKGLFIRKEDKRLPILEKRVVSLPTMVKEAKSPDGWGKGFEEIVSNMWDKKKDKRFEFFLSKQGIKV